jgi:hypothetical protein
MGLWLTVESVIAGNVLNHLVVFRMGLYPFQFEMRLMIRAVPLAACLPVFLVSIISNQNRYKISIYTTSTAFIHHALLPLPLFPLPG